jgi:hypothetical protein
MRLKYPALLIVFFLSPMAIPCFSQFKDFRPATVIKSNGDSLVAKVNYKMNFQKSEKILIKTPQSKQEIPVSEVEKIIFSSREVYTVISEDGTQEKVLAKTYLDGRISLHRAGDLYYLKTDTNLYKLDDRPVMIEIDGLVRSTPSKKYLSTLKNAFMDCQTQNYEPLDTRINLKPLTKLIYQYGECKNITIRNVARKPTIELAFLAGISALQLNASFTRGSVYNSGKGFFCELSFLSDLGPSNRLKVRLDLNYLKADISGSFTTPYSDSWGVKEEYIAFSTTFNGLRIPLGVQYHFFNNNSSLYLSGGILFAINNYNDFDAEGYFAYNANGTKIYEPSFKDHFEVSPNPIGGLWCAVGGDIRLSDRFKLNIEMRGIRAAFGALATVSDSDGRFQKMQSVRINEFNSSLGLKYRLQ